MNRRQAISLGAAAAVAIPAGLVWWNKSKIGDSTLFNENRQAILAAAVEAIIPETGTPGAKSLGVDLFVAKMLTDCYDPEAQTLFGDGLVELDKQSKKMFSKAFKLTTPAERLEVLKSFPEDDKFISLLKGLTVRGYNSSEYVMTNIRQFEFIPGRYIGCVNLNENA
ncbi:gluconate 2-dehydrogenase subunit 3 family protein [Leadbetterella sp. DM7]|uniref:gluconate 2-dehydrogenase subunit 3 family protein n=1 Tax=Leadbetterella sp. DM7 TaxID=3235085 RepID=UPI00349E64E3